jgi:hypothetical protein
MLSSCKNKKSQTAIEVQHFQDTSTVVVKRDTSNFNLSNFTVIEKDDSLQLAFTNNKAFDLFIIKTKDSIHSELQQNWAVTDSSFIMPTFKTLYEDISFNKEHYKKGDKLESKIALSIVGYHQWPDTYTDTLAVNGWIKATVN